MRARSTSTSTSTVPPSLSRTSTPRRSRRRGMTATLTDSKPLVAQLAELAEADTNVLVKKTAERALLMDLTIHQWEGRHQIEGADVSLGGKQLPKHLTSKSHWVLRPEAWSKCFSTMA